MSETYRIDLAARRVYVTIDGVERLSGWLSFDFLASYPSPCIARGFIDYASPIGSVRGAAYAVARDELLDRGLIQEEDVK